MLKTECSMQKTECTIPVAPTSRQLDPTGRHLCQVDRLAFKLQATDPVGSKEATGSVTSPWQEWLYVYVIVKMLIFYESPLPVFP